VSFVRAVHDWEVEAFVSFLRVLYLAGMSCGGSFPKEDCLLLNPFTVSWVTMIVFDFSFLLKKCLAD
jgi:hypothetical protein